MPFPEPTPRITTHKAVLRVCGVVAAGRGDRRLDLVRAAEKGVVAVTMVIVRCA